MAKKKVTMEEIAKDLKVSKVTVSKALANKEGVSEELRQAIIDLAKKKGYHYRGNTENKSGKIITVVVRERYITQDNRVAPPYYMELYGRLVELLAEKGYVCNLVTVRFSVDTRPQLESIVAQTQTSGIIVLGALSESYLKLIRSTKKPLVFLDTSENLDSDSAVLVDNYNGSCELTKYCLRNGGEKIAFVGTVQATTSILDRYLGYCRALVLAGHDIDTNWLIEDRDHEGREKEMELPEVLPDTFLCNCSESAFKLVKKLEKLGLKVPEEVSVVGFDDDVFSKLSHPPLTIFAVAMDQMVAKAVNLLQLKIEQPYQSVPDRVYVQGSVIERESFLKKERE